MATQAFRRIHFKPDSLARIEVCNRIIEEYQEQGLRLTLRQLYYQHVAKNLLPNEEKAYKGLAKLVSDGRLAGLIDWDAIEDRGRVPQIPSEFRDIDHIVDVAVKAYRLPRWKGQGAYVELHVEKQALAGVLEPLASEFHVTLQVNKGYASQSSMYETARRFIEHTTGGDEDEDGFARLKRPVLFYLGDHDPSGQDMLRDIEDRLLMFGVAGIEVRKLALTMVQIEEHNPPPNPAKRSDPRHARYAAEHGRSSWEVDALPPIVLRRIIREAFNEVIDWKLMNPIKKQEEKDKAALMSVAAARLPAARKKPKRRR